MASFDDLARAAGFLVVGEHVYCAEPTRKHILLIMGEGDGWIVWEGHYHERYADGKKPMEQRIWYRGRDFKAALRKAAWFAGRFKKRNGRTRAH